MLFPNQFSERCYPLNTYNVFNSFEAASKLIGENIAARLALFVSEKVPYGKFTRRLWASASYYTYTVQHTYELCIICGEWVISKHAVRKAHPSCNESVQKEWDDRDAAWAAFFGQRPTEEIQDLSEREAVTSWQEEQLADQRARESKPNDGTTIN